MCASPAAARGPSARPLGSLRISPAGVRQQDGSTSAERNGFSLFAFPAMNRWAFFYCPAERDCIREAERICWLHEQMALAPHLQKTHTSKGGLCGAPGLVRGLKAPGGPPAHL